MSEANGKVCCNCRHCIRVENGHGNHITCKCDIDGKYLGYIEVMSFWCRRWARSKFIVGKSEVKE